MTLEQLRIFVAVAEHEHVTQAARKLSLTQSATSAAIAALEGRYATKLFDRIGRRIALTEAGRLFLIEAKAVLQRAGAAETMLVDFAGLKRGALSLAASQTVGNYWLPKLIHRYRSRYPGISLSLSLGNTETVAARLHDGAADLGFIEGQIDDPILIVRPVAEDRLVLVVAADHPWARKPPRSPEDFCSASWICRERGSGTRSILEAALPALGIAREGLQIALELPSNEAVCTAVEAGAGVTIISRLVVERALTAGLLVAIAAD
jgi:DNA-binding transcriptional LysR family regulator